MIINKSNSRKMNTFSIIPSKLEFGDFLLFQEYKQERHDDTQYHYKVSKPILAIYLGCFAADQTMGFNYVRWVNENHMIYITNEHVTNYKTFKEVSEIENHIEWNDYIDILGHWKQRPTWKDIIKSYRQQNTHTTVSDTEIEFID